MTVSNSIVLSNSFISSSFNDSIYSSSKLTIILFLIPTLVEFLLTLLNIGVTATDPTCGLK